MDPFTHVGLSALGARSVKSGLPLRWSLGAAVLGAAFPDIDYALLWVDPLSFHAYWHRSFTHSLVLLPLWSALLAGLLYGLSRGRHPFVRLWGYAALGLAFHIALDLATSWPMHLFWPLSDQRLVLGWLFVIDPWFTGLAVLGLLASLRWQKAVWVVWLGLALWVGGAVYHKQEARQVARAYAASLDQPARGEAWPQPFSPRHWKLLVSTEEGHWQAYVHLGEEPLPPASLWPHPWLRRVAQNYSSLDNPQWRYHPRFAGPSDNGALARQVWQSDSLRDLRYFLRYPARHPAGDASECLWFAELLYTLPEQTPPFIYGICRGPDGHWDRVRRW